MGFITGTDRGERIRELQNNPFMPLVAMLCKAGYHKEVAKIFRDELEKRKRR